MATHALAGTTGKSNPFAHPFLLLRENRFAHTAVRQLSRREGRKGPSLVFLHGHSGCGKSHLVQSFLRDDPFVAAGSKYLRTTAADFGDELSKAVEADATREFRSIFEDLDLLVLEDVQGFGRVVNPQERFVTMMDLVIENGGRVLVTGLRSPGDLPGLIPRLVSRCVGGVVAGIEPLAKPSRTSLLGHFASSRQIPAPLDVLQLLAKEGPTTPREMLATLVQLELQTRENGESLTRATVRQHLAHDDIAPDIPLKRIAAVVARAFEISVRKLRGGDRAREHALPRQCAMALARELTRESLQSIADFFGRKNHSTVLHAVQRVTEMVEEDPALGQRLRTVRRELGAPLTAK